MNCKYYKTRTKNYKKIGYCTKFRKEVPLFCKCSECIEYKTYNDCENKDRKIKKCTINQKYCAKSKIKGKKHKLTKATEISKKVKMVVWERDDHKCIFCKTEVSWNYANSHFIKRSHSGLGIERNIMTNCESCHKLFEESLNRNKMKEFARDYFLSIYEDWCEEELVYRK